MKKETVKSVNAAFQTWRIIAKNYIGNLRFPAKRNLAQVSAADAQGRINGMTIPELLAFVNLSALTSERVVLEAEGKTLILAAEKFDRELPVELR